MKNENPIQPIIDGRFKENKIVSDLLDFAQSKGFGLNEIAMKNYSKTDRQQFAQLIGYSVSGYGSLSYVDNDHYGIVDRICEYGETETEAKITYLQDELTEIRKVLSGPVSKIYGIHPDDLMSSEWD